MDDQRSILIGVILKNELKENSLSSLIELEDLSKTAGFIVYDKIIQIRHQIHPKYYLGIGKLNELKEIIDLQNIKYIIFDDDLTPLQTYEIENLLKCNIISRTELILTIFAKNARTRQSKLQVEYAKLTYLYPRLKQSWTHLSRIEGGIGLRGPGETQLEIDRRIIKKKISNIKLQLKKIKIQSDTRNKKRIDKNIVCLIGYTNAGKSTLFSQLSNNPALIDNSLFSTLDSKVRKTFIYSDLNILLIDTVGFIRKLPHQLISSFKTTLDDVKSAKLLIHVIDITEDNVFQRIESVNSVLKELDVMKTPIIYVFNKIDKLDQTMELPERFIKNFPDGCFISAKSKQGIDYLKKLIYKHFMN